ncbi:MAG: endonuclease/exonuclease/phosphatase family protein [Pseudomonadota bacterium]
MAWCWALAAQAEALRIATFHTELQRKGPGLFLRDLSRGAKDIDFVLERMAKVDADIWVLQGIDYDAEGLALDLLARKVGLKYAFALPPNTGVATGLDLDGDGRTGGPRDAQGFGWFSGQGGIAVLSRYPVSLEADRSADLWADLDWAPMPQLDGAAFYSEKAAEVLRLSNTGHWALRVSAPGGQITLITAYATTPVFDGPEDRNGLRNANELRLAARMMEATEGPTVIAGNFNLDPQAGEGRREVMAKFLARPDLHDPLPGEPTVDFGASSAGKLRVSYVLPSAELSVLDAGVATAERPTSSGDVRFTRHHPVWVDLELQGGS